MDINQDRYKFFTKEKLDSELLRAARDNKHDDVVLLLNSGANVNTCNEVGETALTFSAYYNNVKTAKLLIEHGAKDFNSTNNPKGYKTALMVAADCNAPKIVELLLDNNTDADMKTTDKRGRTAFTFALDYLHNEMASRFLLRMTPVERAWEAAVAAVHMKGFHHINTFRTELKFNASKLFILAMRLVRLGEKSQFMSEVVRKIKIDFTSLALIDFPSWYPVEEHMTLAQSFIEDKIANKWKNEEKKPIVFLYQTLGKNNKRNHEDDNKGPAFKKFKIES